MNTSVIQMMQGIGWPLGARVLDYLGEWVGDNVYAGELASSLKERCLLRIPFGLAAGSSWSGALACC
ncbi:MAG: hypothetical protein HQL41_05060 [Alphaproteobacteria bacterium]|nr:hypothetical protein [Alphaproteobacteria bacterium]